MLRVHFATAHEIAPAIPVRSELAIAVHDADMVAVPRVGDWVELGEKGIWRVNEVIWRVQDRLTRRNPDVDVLVEPLDDDASAAATISDIRRAREGDSDS